LTLLQDHPIKRISASPELTSPGIRVAPEFAKLVDISRCIGCKGCEVACKEWNDLEAEPTANFGSYQSHTDLSAETWLLMRFTEIEVQRELHWLITKDACLHCQEPGCLYACPAPGAVVQYENGIVDFNQEKCIGCRYCIPGCPFDIPRFNETTQKVYKCNMCIDRVEAGLEPACVKTCPTGAIAYGTKEDMLSLANQRVASLMNRGYANAMVYDPAGVGGTHMMYVIPHGNRLADYGLPENPQARPGAISALAVFKTIGGYMLGLGVLATALHFLAVGPQSPQDEESGGGD
jgi:formate dehydrogenase iron-sulfur subunit